MTDVAFQLKTTGRKNLESRLGSKVLASVLGKLGPSGSEVLEEELLVLGVLLDPGAELLVLDKGKIGGEHHKVASRVLELLGALPLLALVLGLLGPLLIEEQAEELVTEGGGGVGPGAPVATVLSVAAANGVGAGKGNDLLVVEALAVEDVAEVVSGVLATAIGVRETTVGERGAVLGLVRATRAESTVGATHLFDGGVGSKDPQVRVGDLGVLGLDGLYDSASLVKTSVGAPLGLGSETHTGTITATVVLLLVEGTTAVPAKADEHGAEGAIVVGLALKSVGDLLRDLLVVHRLGGGGSGGGSGLTTVVVVGTTGSGGDGEEADHTTVAALLGLTSRGLGGLSVEEAARDAGLGGHAGAGGTGDSGEHFD